MGGGVTSVTVSFVMYVGVVGETTLAATAGLHARTTWALLDPTLTLTIAMVRVEGRHTEQDRFSWGKEAGD